MDEKGPDNVWDSEKDEYQAVLLSYDLLPNPPNYASVSIIRRVERLGERKE
jgi:hypothetical protein